MSQLARHQFVRQQGFWGASAASCAYYYPALMFQPRVLVALVLVAVMLQSSLMCLTLGSMLWWSALVPTRNPFDILYNRVIACPKQLPLLTPAPEPRRFAHALTGSILIGAGLSSIAGWIPLALTLESTLLVTLAVVVFGRFCVGSYIYHRLRGDRAFANRTLPWSRTE